MSSEERQGEILKIGLRIIHEEGYKNLTVRNIADRINISEPAIYRHFENKEEILRNLANMVFEKSQAPTNPNEYEDPYDLLGDLLYNHLERLEENPHITAVLFQGEIFREYPEIKELFTKHHEAKKETLKNIIKNGQEKGHFSKETDPEIFALLFMGAVRMSALEWRDNKFSYSLTEKADKITEELFKILKR